MKKYKKIIGTIIALVFVLLVIFSFIINVITGGWYFILSLVVLISIVFLFLWGISLLFK